MKFERGFGYHNRVSNCRSYRVMKVKERKVNGFVMARFVYRADYKQEETWIEGPKFRTLDEGKKWCSNHSRSD